MKINQFDRTNLKALRTDMEAALKAVAEKYGISIVPGRATFMPANATFKVECATIGAGGIVRNSAAEVFKRSACFYGLKPEDLGRTVRISDHTYKITGLRSKGRKFPILAEREDGRQFKLPLALVRAQLQTATA